MAVAINDIWKFALESTLFGQQIINTFACRVVAVPGATAEQDWVNNWFLDNTGHFNVAGNLRREIADLQTNQVTHVRWIVQRMTPGPTQPFIVPLTTAVQGTLAGDCETGNICLSLFRRGALAGRRYKGRVAIPGQPTTEMASGKFSAALVTSATTKAVSLYGLKTRVAGDVVHMGYWSPAHTGLVKKLLVTYPALFVECVSGGARDTIRVQRSRTIGVGR